MHWHIYTVFLQMPPGSVIGGARALCGHHRCTQRPLRRTECSKRGTIFRFLDPSKNLTADANFRFTRGDHGYIEKLLRVVIAKFRTQMIAAHRDIADAAPIAIPRLENLRDEILCDQISLAIQYS